MRQNSKQSRNCNGRVLFPLFLILLGGVFLLFNAGIIPIEYKSIIISWQMLLIVIGLGSLIKRDFTGGAILIAIGAIFIYPKLCVLFPGIGLGVECKSFWPIALIVVGVILLSKRPSFKCDVGSKVYDKNDSDYISKSLMFGSSEQIVFSENLKGGKIDVMFGEIIVDLRKAKLAEGTSQISMNIMLASGIIYVPEDWNVEIDSSVFLGSFEDKRLSFTRNSESKSTLIIKGSSFLGGGEVRN